MKILLTGASGFIGQHLLMELINAKHQVIACCRNPQRLRQRFPEVVVLSADYSNMTDVTDWLPYLHNVVIVINAVGIIQESAKQSFANLHANAPIALFQACEAVGTKVIQISALDAGSQQATRYHASKGIADELLQSLAIDWFIFRPSIVYGSGAKSMALFRALAALPVIPLVSDGKQQIQPVYIDDLVAAILRCVNDQRPTRQVVNAVGPQPIAFVDLMEKLGQWLGKVKVHTLPSPAWTVPLLAPLGRLIGEPALNRESIAMLQHGNTADVEPFANHLGYLPKHIDQVLQHTIPTQADRWHAYLYFMKPTLRFAIAVVWLWAGCVSAFVYPLENSYQMLAQVGISATHAPIVLYSASALDFALGIALLLNWRLRQVIYAQIAIMLIYSVVISITLPEYWAHPFGPMIKNLPLLVALLILLILEEQKP
ncbi:MAG TPA: SDR family oxidoreductase [Crenotrichaceae bacterium]|nr:SDR family oxidoreductase [Crenotrichaceae bacterium]